MSAWLIFGIIIGLLALIAITKVGFSVEFHEDELRLRLYVGAISIDFPRKKRTASKTHSNAVKKRAGKKNAKKKWMIWAKAAWGHWDEILSLCSRILTAPTIEILKLYIAVGGDPDECAIRYGQICAFAAGLLAPLENTFAVLKRNIGIYCTFDSDKLKIDLETRLTLRIYEVVALLTAGLRLILCLYREVNMNKKVV